MAIYSVEKLGEESVPSLPTSSSIVLNTAIGDLKTNSATTQKAVIQGGDQILCDGITKLYPKMMTGEALYYTDEFFAFMEANYPTQISECKIITMPKINEDDRYELITNEHGTAYKYNDGRLTCKCKDISVSGSGAVEVPMVFPYPLFTTDAMTYNAALQCNSGGLCIMPSNNSANLYRDSLIWNVTTTGAIFWIIVLSTEVQPWIVTCTINGIWKEHASRYQYMCVNAGSIDGLSYSTDEKLSGGTWVDGRAIYLAMVEVIANGATNQFTPTNIPKTAQILSVSGIVDRASALIPHQYITLPTSESFLSVDARDGEFMTLRSDTPAGWKEAKMYINMEYVKAVQA